MTADYSRQVLLKEIGAAGQAKLGSARVLIVGAGGLGSPVLQYLAAAGVGCLGIVDGDTLDASNLHRQPLYRRADVGRAKVELARAALQELNPDVAVEAHAVELTADNALDLVGRYDLVVDCTDNFRAKFLINDAAVLTQRPAIFASVYQYEGQLQLYKPEAGHACLRCLWLDATADGLVGNCAQTGVLGPVPGTFGSAQALLALKVLAGLPGQLAGELLLWDFMNFSSVKLKAPRRAECVAPSCAHIQALHGAGQDLEVRLNALPTDGALQLIDVRSAEEFAFQPTPATHLPMATLLGDPEILSRDTHYLMICATGKRSLATARALNKLGFNVKSLAGGLAGLKDRHALQK